MAFYIEMDKVTDTDEFVEYTFGRDKEVGLIRLNKKDQTVSVIQEYPLDSSGKWSQRAAVKLVRLWRDKSLPDKTQWAS
jgi:hypothetical protein